MRSCGGASRSFGMVAKLDVSAAGFAVAARLVDVAAEAALLLAAGSPEPLVLPLVAPVRLVDVFLSSVPHDGETYTPIVYYVV